jgi:hypothetical protein
MGKYLAIYNGIADDTAKGEFSQEQQREFMAAWGAWAQANQHALLDPGSPLNTKKVVTAQGVKDFTDSKTGYAIVEADSHDEAIQIFAKHPHLSLIQGNSIEVLECPPVPGQPG